MPGHKLCGQEKNSQSKNHAMIHAKRDTGVSLDYFEIRFHPSPLHILQVEMYLIARDAKRCEQFAHY